MNKQQLSKREKILIYVMILCVIAGGGTMLIRRINASYSTAVSAYEDKKMEKETLNLELSRLDTIQQDIDEKQLFYEQNKSVFLTKLTEDKVETKILDYMKSTHLDVTNTEIKIDTKSESQDSNKITLNEATSDDEVSLVNQVAGQSDSTDSKKEENTVNYVVAKVNVTAKGSFRNFHKLLGTAADDLRLRVTSYSIYDENDSVVYSTNAQNQYTYNMVLEYYMMP